MEGRNQIVERLIEKLNLYILLPVSGIFAYLVPDQTAYNILVALLLLIIADSITGLTRAAKTQDVTSHLFFKGIIVKLVNYGAVIILAVSIEHMIETMYFATGGVLLRTALIGLAITEGISITENLTAQGFKIPKIINDALAIMKTKSEDTKLGEDK